LRPRLATGLPFSVLGLVSLQRHYRAAACRPKGARTFVLPGERATGGASGEGPWARAIASVGYLTADNPGSDFNWGDAGIGAAATLALIAVSAAALSATRRTGSSRQPSLHRG
jgi:hypothetical protein